MIVFEWNHLVPYNNCVLARVL